MWEILLNSVLNGWLKLLIIVLARKWAVLLTNCKWAVVNSIRIQKWAVHSYKSQMGISSLPHTCGPTKLTHPLKKKLTRMQGFVTL